MSTSRPPDRITQCVYVKTLGTTCECVCMSQWFRFTEFCDITDTDQRIVLWLWFCSVPFKFQPWFSCPFPFVASTPILCLVLFLVLFWQNFPWCVTRSVLSWSNCLHSCLVIYWVFVSVYILSSFLFLPRWFAIVFLLVLLLISLPVFVPASFLLVCFFINILLRKHVLFQLKNFVRWLLPSSPPEFGSSTPPSWHPTTQLAAVAVSSKWILQSCRKIEIRHILWKRQGLKLHQGPDGSLTKPGCSHLPRLSSNLAKTSLQTLAASHNRMSAQFTA